VEVLAGSRRPFRVRSVCRVILNLSVNLLVEVLECGFETLLPADFIIRTTGFTV
jgi:hypothetical protein